MSILSKPKQSLSVAVLLVTFLAAGAAWVVQAGTFVPTLRLYGRSPLLALALPVAGVLYLGMTLDSARRHGRGVGGGWKGRTVEARSDPGS